MRRPLFTLASALSLLLCVATVVLWVRGAGRAWRTSRTWRVREGHCPICRYNLTANTTGVCPECGTAIQPSAIRPKIDKLRN